MTSQQRYRRNKPHVRRVLNVKLFDPPKEVIAYLYAERHLPKVVEDAIKEVVRVVHKTYSP